ncbi:MAG: ATP phosphoribosyltransferase regulatory subunit [Lachnospiraceae bacterium]|nr:ATP phosphoribosyltransferase regulatory subunit [Lachnospiraceae bacterium]
MIENNINPSVHTALGVRDIYGEECAYKNKLQHIIHKVFKSYGFYDIQTPAFEFFDVFAKEKGTVPSNQMFKFFDRDNNTLVLRPDITPSVARCIAKYYKDEEFEIRMSYIGNTFVNVPPYKGKLQEVTQAGIELFNDDTSDADAEMISIACECLLKCGLEEFQVELGHADFIKGLFEEAGFDKENGDKIKELIQTKNFFGVEDMLDKLTVSEDIKNIFLNLPKLQDDFHTSAENIEKVTKNDKILNALDRLKKVYALLEKHGVSKYITIDLSEFSTYEYYTGVIFKAYTYGSGEALLSGGRYDSLVGQFGKNVPAIGVAITVDELVNAAVRHGNIKSDDYGCTIILYDRDNVDEALSKAKSLRENGENIRTIRKSSRKDMSAYEEYAKRINAKELIYIGGLA